MNGVEPRRSGRGSSTAGSREQIVVDLTERVLSEAVQAIVRLENDGIDASEAIRTVRAALIELPIADADLAGRLDQERGRAELEDAPDDRELGGQG
jgi:hypothetical protein